MAFDERLADRIRTALGRRKGLTEKKMFGGIGFLANGNMCCGVHKDEMIVGIAPDETASALKQAHTRRLDLTGRPMNGWLLVEPAGVKSAAGAQKGGEGAGKYASTLP